MPKIQLPKPIEIKMASVMAVSAILHESDPALLDVALREFTGEDRDYFDNDFAVIDVGSLTSAGAGIDWPVLIALFKSYRLNPVAVRNALPEMEADILAHGLSLDIIAKPRREITPEIPEESVSTPDEAPPIAATPPMPRNAMIINTPVRAGQQIYARDSDLIVMAVVNSGAEIIADGNIHVYAPLRGRALAGAKGNTEARIFTLSMEAELVSIAGVYNTFEEGFSDASVGRPTQIRLIGNRIDVLPMNSDARS